MDLQSLLPTGIIAYAKEVCNMNFKISIIVSYANGFNSLSSSLSDGLALCFAVNSVKLSFLPSFSCCPVISLRSDQLRRASSSAMLIMVSFPRASASL